MKLIFVSEPFHALERALAAARPALRRLWASEMVGMAGCDTTSARWRGGGTTPFDLRFQAILVKAIVEHCPDISLFAEDGGLVHTGRSGQACLIDPLDATHNAYGGYPAFTCNVALHDGERYVFAWVYDPSRDVTYTAAAGLGAFVHTGVLAKRLTVGSGAPLEEAALAIMRGHRSPSGGLMQFLFNSAGKIRLSSCSSFDLCLVAAGTLNGFVDLSEPGHERSCDIAASALILLEAGGLVLDDRGYRRETLPPSLDALHDRGPLIAVDSVVTAKMLIDQRYNFEREHHAHV